MEQFPSLETKTFTAEIADNRALAVHRAGYNGVASLVPRATGENLFVPAFAGLNYETIRLEGLPPYPDKFEPRKEPMHVQDADDERVVLVQSETSHARVGARITFRVEEPGYLHQRIEITCHRRFCPAGVPNRFESLFASYLQTPRDRHVYLPGKKVPGTFFGVTRPSHESHDWKVRPLPEEDLDAAGHLKAIEATDPLPGLDMTDRRDPRWSGSVLPELLDGPLTFYYGLSGELMLLMMFREPERFRLAYSPCGGGTEPAWNPAWDYLLVLDDAEIDTTYEWNLCAAVKPFAGCADVLDEVRRYAEAAD